MSGLRATPASSVPVLALGDVLLVTLQGELHDATAEQLQDHITHRIAHHPVPVGSIGARLRTGTGWQPLISHPGIVGAHFPATVPLRRAAWQPDSLLVLHSDGLPSRWVPPLDPLLLAHDPAVVAAVVLRDSGSAARPLRDDTSVAVLTPATGGAAR